MTSEIDEIKARYERRKLLDYARLYPKFSAFQHFSKCERDFWFGHLLQQRFGNFENLKMLEVGAGNGANLFYFLNLGMDRHAVYANDLLPERATLLETVLPKANVFLGDARTLAVPGVNVILQSTVFSSILDSQVQQELAAHLWSLLAPGGIFLWYDMIIDNPRNTDVKAVSKKQLSVLFPNAAQIWTKRVTLAPPLGRRVGRLYNFINFPFLRSHMIAGIFKA